MSDKSERRRQAKLSKKEQALIHSFIVKALSEPGGQKFFLHLLARCGIGNNPFTHNALSTSFACGELNIGQYINGLLLEADTAGYVRMIKEQENGGREHGNDRDDEPDLFGGDHSDGGDDGNEGGRDPFGDEEPID